MTPTLWRHEKISRFQHIQEEFISPVLDSFSPPTDLSCYLTCDLRLLLPSLWINVIVEKYGKLYLKKVHPHRTSSLYVTIHHYLSIILGIISCASPEIELLVALWMSSEFQHRFSVDNRNRWFLKNWHFTCLYCWLRIEERQNILSGETSNVTPKVIIPFRRKKYLPK